MSHSNVNDLASSFVQMAKAFEELPAVQLDLQNATVENDRLRDTIQRLELNAIDRKNEIDTLLSRISALEVARDDAELRFLEADETLHNVLGNLRSVQAIVGQEVTRLDPPKAEVVVEAVVPAPTPLPEGWDNHPDWVPEVTQTQSDPITTDTAPLSGTTLPTSAATVQNTETTDAACAPVEVAASPSLPYLGKRYYDFPTWISQIDWLAGGGTYEDYTWHPSKA